VNWNLGLFDAFVIVDILNTHRSGVATKELFQSKLLLLLRRDGSTNGLDVKIMPLRPLVAARAGSQEEEAGTVLIILANTVSVWLSISFWSTTSLILWAQKPCSSKMDFISSMKMSSKVVLVISFP
jgi:hypothetical protein